ncbi:MAG: peptidylprolyl isomerase [Gammaproteobacteria bacterium]|nr:peptidylprolyl isomerase [Gammaproteobacteria bacterium]MDH3846734.1 peptidylprolyl isomerase [Gammaproteobacteria bacterium]MDH3865365.1 peptidylprolyl isomerase [Gammaproteobacteria bacterium]MDH3904734.1 peptidylprolyl isomerase [Gammaproteobacteria bacterium]MDH4005104.1 peptidylprolyl isomerase [Gammaproteobacteria bacterium]
MIVRACISMALLLVSAAGLHAQGIYPGDAVRVNDETVSNQRFQGFYTEYRNTKGVAVGARGDQLELLKQLRREAMDLIIEQTLVGQAAEEAGIEADPAEVEKQVEELRSVFDNDDGFRMKLQDDGFTEESYRHHIARMISAKIYLDRIRADAWDVSDVELERYYEDNESRLTLPERVRVRHILLTWKPLGTQDDRAAIHKQMEPILERVRNGEDFAKLATQFSDDYATKNSGGDTGLFTRGTMVPAFEDVAFALEPGEISDPVETVFGVHILRLEERSESRLLPLDEVREQLREHVREEKMEIAVQEKIDELRTAADIEILIPLASRN